MSENQEDRMKVRIPYFPLYAEVRCLLRVWTKYTREQVTGLRRSLQALTGSPQDSVDWQEPELWIPERLSGTDSELALAIWESSEGTVNPRHTYGHWSLCQRYELFESSAGENLKITALGQDFLDNEGGATVAHLDEQEGLAKILELLALYGPARPGELLDPWAEFLHASSLIRSISSCRGYMSRRLRNLAARELVTNESSGFAYAATDAGLSYLKRLGHGNSPGGEEQTEIRKLARLQLESVRNSLLEHLMEMDPFAFERLVKHLLEAMNYRNVRVTAPSGDGGVDVIGDIEVGISSVKEVVQAKRHRRTIQRKELDALRGSLYRFNAMRGTIITTSQFSSGALKEAQAERAAPITLIDGEKLLDLLVQNSIGVSKRRIELVSVDIDALSEFENE